MVGNEDGGAHVDPGLSETYHALTRENAMGWRFQAAGTDDDGVPFLNGPVLASIRQIAWELEHTPFLFLWKELGLGGPSAHRFRSPDAEPIDARWRSGELDSMPSISFRSTLSGGPTGRRYKLTHPTNSTVRVRRAAGSVPESP